MRNSFIFSTSLYCMVGSCCSAVMTSKALHLVKSSSWFLCATTNTELANGTQTNGKGHSYFESIVAELLNLATHHKAQSVCVRLKYFELLEKWEVVRKNPFKI